MTDPEHSPEKEDVLTSTISTDPKHASAEKEWDFSDIDVKKLNRKIDFKLVPWLAVLYLLSFLDRSAIGNARLFGLEEDLGLTDVQYKICVTVFYFTYSLFEVPSNILLKRLTPSIWFGTITVFVGICMMAQGLVSNYGGLVAARVCLGIAEAGLFPGANYLMSGWYPRSKFGLRASIFFAAASVSGAFGGLISTGLAQIRGGMYAGPNDGWRWIFIVIGLITVVAGFLSFKLCADFPDTAKFLTDKERAYVIHNLQSQQQHSAAGEAFTWMSVGKGFFDIKTVLAALIYMGVDGPLYAFSVFTPTIIKSLGTWSSVESNFLSVPIYVLAGIVTVSIGFYADRKGHRAAINLVMIPISIIGYIILLAVDPNDAPGASYFGVYLSAMGIYPMIPNTIAFTGSHVEGAYKKSVVMAVIISWGNINGAATSQVYLSRESPRYYTGHAIIIAYLAIGWLSTWAYIWVVKRENARRERGECTEEILDHLPEEEAVTSAADARARQIQEVQSSGGGLRNRIKLLKLKLHAAPGGTYASVNEARRMKGDDYSGHRFSI
ncbi:unnamed protein product [Sympodiomycopsis kandeliae]